MHVQPLYRARETPGDPRACPDPDERSYRRCHRRGRPGAAAAPRESRSNQLRSRGATTPGCRERRSAIGSQRSAHPTSPLTAQQSRRSSRRARSARPSAASCHSLLCDRRRKRGTGIRPARRQRLNGNRSTATATRSDGPTGDAAHRRQPRRPQPRPFPPTTPGTGSYRRPRSERPHRRPRPDRPHRRPRSERADWRPRRRAHATTTIAATAKARAPSSRRARRSRARLHPDRPRPISTPSQRPRRRPTTTSGLDHGPGDADTPARRPTTPAGDQDANDAEAQQQGRRGFSVSGLTAVWTKPAHVQQNSNPLLSAHDSGLRAPLSSHRESLTRIATSPAGAGLRIGGASATDRRNPDRRAAPRPLRPLAN